MEIDLYDFSGEAVAYIVDDGEKSIYLWNGEVKAYIDDNSNIYKWNGQHIGFYEDGILYDLEGYRRGFIKEKCPVYTKYLRYKSYKRYKPYKGYKEYAQYKPYFTSQNADEPLELFLQL